jgi:penicillin-insensitive murein endopeptidase
MLAACAAHVTPPEPAVSARTATEGASAETPPASDASRDPTKYAGGAGAAAPQNPAGTTADPGISAETDDSDSASEEGGEVDDDVETANAEPGSASAPHPLDGMSRSKLEATLMNDPKSLGSMSVGYPNSGALVNGEPMPTGEQWQVLHPANAFGTHETISYLIHCVQKVNATFPDTPPMFIGDLGARRGGHLFPHVSHQSGRDVDVGYYYVEGGHWYDRARADNLDRARTWTFVRALITETDVELILIDRSVQRLLRSYAASAGEDTAWLDQIFEGSETARPIIRHAKGHATHIHVRFYNPVAQETGRRAYDLLLTHRLIEPPVFFARYKVKKGETVSAIARRYKLTWQAFEQINGMKTPFLREGSEYKIPRRGGVRAVPGPIAIPARRLPPDAASRGVASTRANPADPGSPVARSAAPL